MLSLTDPLGRKTAYTCDAIGNVMSITRLVGTPDAVTDSILIRTEVEPASQLYRPFGAHRCL